MGTWYDENVGSRFGADLPDQIGLGSTDASSHGAVSRWQRILELPNIDGQFGPHTKAATITKQRQLKVKDDGIVGPITWGAVLGNPQSAEHYAAQGVVNVAHHVTAAATGATAEAIAAAGHAEKDVSTHFWFWGLILGVAGLIGYKTLQATK